MGMELGARPFRRTGAGDFFDAGASKIVIVLKGAKLVAGSGAAATAQITDTNGTVLAELSAPAAGADWLDVPVLAEGKVTLASITGAGAICMAYLQ